MIFPDVRPSAADKLFKKQAREFKLPPRKNLNSQSMPPSPLHQQKLGMISSRMQSNQTINKKLLVTNSGVISPAILVPQIVEPS